MPEEIVQEFKVGAKYGLLIVLSIGRRVFGKVSCERSCAICVCQCGTEITTLRKSLVSGKTKSCGRCVKRKPRACATPDPETGSKHGRLTVLGSERRVGERGRSLVWIICRCDCGTEKGFLKGNILQGLSTSCGCIAAEKARKRLTEHGLSKGKSRIWEIWRGMRQRCNNPNKQHYHNYGGRGISVCDRWEIFLNFHEDIMSLLDQSLGLKDVPENLSIDRVDNNGNYEPGNVRLATNIVQSRNKRTNVFLTIGDETKIILDWSKSSGVPANTIRKRMLAGWDHKSAVWTTKGTRIKERV